MTELFDIVPLLDGWSLRIGIQELLYVRKDQQLNTQFLELIRDTLDTLQIAGAPNYEDGYDDGIAEGRRLEQQGA